MIILFRIAVDTHAVTVVGLPAISTPNVITHLEHGRSLPLESVRPTGPGGVTTSIMPNELSRLSDIIDRLMDISNSGPLHINGFFPVRGISLISAGIFNSFFPVGLLSGLTSCCRLILSFSSLS